MSSEVETSLDISDNISSRGGNRNSQRFLDSARNDKLGARRGERLYNPKSIVITCGQKMIAPITTAAIAVTSTAPAATSLASRTIG